MTTNTTLLDQYYYTKKNKPRLIIQCYSCKTKTMKLIEIDYRYMSGDLHVYECSKCGRIDRTIL